MNTLKRMLTLALEVLLSIAEKEELYAQILLTRDFNFAIKKQFLMLEGFYSPALRKIESMKSTKVFSRSLMAINESKAEIRENTDHYHLS